MISVNEVAAAKFKEIAAKKNNPDRQMLRISFGGYGWGGPQLNLTLDELKQVDDKVVESNGIKVVYSKDIEESLNNITVDYLDKWYSRGFQLVGSSIGSCR